MATSAPETPRNKGTTGRDGRERTPHGAERGQNLAYAGKEDLQTALALQIAFCGTYVRPAPTPDGIEQR